MMHDPFQNYATLGSYHGIPAPLGLQYPSLQASINPAAAVNPLLGLSPMAQGGIPQVGQSPYGLNPGFPGLAANPQQLQLASLLASQLGFQNPVLAASLLSNPLIAASLHSQALGSYGVPQFGLQQPSLYPQIGQVGSPF